MYSNKSTLTFISLLLHRVLRRITLIIPTNALVKKIHIKTLKMAPTCFDHKIIIREPCCSLLKSHIKNTH